MEFVVLNSKRPKTDPWRPLLTQWPNLCSLDVVFTSNDRPKMDIFSIFPTIGGKITRANSVYLRMSLFTHARPIFSPSTHKGHVLTLDAYISNEKV